MAAVAPRLRRTPLRASTARAARPARVRPVTACAVLGAVARGWARVWGWGRVSAGFSTRVSTRFASRSAAPPPPAWTGATGVACGVAPGPATVMLPLISMSAQVIVTAYAPGSVVERIFVSPTRVPSAPIRRASETKAPDTAFAVFPVQPLTLRATSPPATGVDGTTETPRSPSAAYAAYAAGTTGARARAAASTPVQSVKRGEPIAKPPDNWRLPHGGGSCTLSRGGLLRTGGGHEGGRGVPEAAAFRAPGWFRSVRRGRRSSRRSWTGGTGSSPPARAG
ncbi:hypothetical protein a10_07656 [Streptomyces acidiscabies]|nr:hypothetical protein a10_07656 [Streptomyces acidiscabies]